MSSVKAQVTQVGTDAALTPAPGLGFSGAAALDADGIFAGIALLKPVVVAGHRSGRRAGGAGGRERSARILEGQWREPGERCFVDARASVVRVICVRK